MVVLVVNDGEMEGWGAGAWPLAGMGPREGLPPGLVWPYRRGEPGGPSVWEARHRRWRRVGPGLWCPPSVEPTLDQRIVEAAARLPAHGAVTGWAALRWWGGRWFEGTAYGKARDVPLALGSRGSIRSGPGVLLSRELLPPGHLVRHRGLRVTSPVWSVGHEMRWAGSLEAAVVVLDMAAYDDLVSLDEVARAVEDSFWIRRGVGLVRDALEHADENSWSPMETLMRLEWVGSGHPRPLTNRPVFTLDGRFLATPDNIDPTIGVYGQYHGGLHLVGDVQSKDIATDAALRRVGLEGVLMTSADLADRRGFRRRLHEAYARAAARTEPPGWTTTPPPWWVVTHSVDRRRTLSAYDRGRLLRYRDAA